MLSCLSFVKWEGRRDGDEVVLFCLDSHDTKTDATNKVFPSDRDEQSSRTDLIELAWQERNRAANHCTREFVRGEGAFGDLRQKKEGRGL